MSLEIKKLSKSFDNKILFSDFSYKFTETGIYVITGESGVGKTTLLRIICGLDADYTGEVSGGGFSNTSIAFQEYRLFPMLSAVENVYIPVGNREDNALKEKAREILLHLGFTDNDMSLKPDSLSGGMKQRVSLARAFLKSSTILLLDEPTKELDTENRKRIYHYLKELSKSKLVIIVSHNTEDIDELKAVKINI